MLIHRHKRTNNKIHTNTSTPNHLRKRQHTLPHLLTLLNYTPTPTDYSSATHTILQHNTTLLLHRAPQLIPNPAPNPLHVHFITQSHVQYSESIIAPQTGRNGAGELISFEVPDEAVRGSAVAGVVYCNDACVIGMRGVLESHCGGLGFYIVFVGECVRA